MKEARTIYLELNERGSAVDECGGEEPNKWVVGSSSNLLGSIESAIHRKLKEWNLE